MRAWVRASSRVRKQIVCRTGWYTRPTCACDCSGQPQSARCTGSRFSVPGVPSTYGAAKEQLPGNLGELRNEIRPEQEPVFPWRSEPFQNLDLLHKLWQYAPLPSLRKLLRLRLYTRLVYILECPFGVVNEVLLRSFRFGFIQAVRSIFDDACKVPQPTLEPQAGVELMSDKHEIDYPSLDQVFDHNCAHVYREAVERARDRKQSVCLEIHDVCAMELLDFSLVHGPSRQAMAASKWGSEYLLGGITYIAKLTRLEDGTLLSEPMYMPAYNRDNHQLWSLTAKLWCREKFFVRDEETQDVIQGTDAIVDAQHFVRFELDLAYETKVAKDWQIVDIDGWNAAGPYMSEKLVDMTYWDWTDDKRRQSPIPDLEQKDQE